MEPSRNVNFPYKICIPYQDQAKGGMYTFFSYFKEYLKRNHIPFTEKLFSSYDCLLVNSFMTRFEKILVRKILQPKLRIVHRIDGAAEDYGRGKEWDVKQKKVNKLVDLTIFQSQYSRFATFEKFKVIGQDGPIIYNPINLSLFRPNQDQVTQGTRPLIAYVTFSTNKKKGIHEFLAVAKSNPDLDFVMIGNCPEEIRSQTTNVRYTGLLNRQDLAKELSKCHYFLFFSRNEACPNVVLEAMASGLVVLYIDSGATKELVADSGFSITEEHFRSTFDHTWPQWKVLSERTRERAEKEFDMDHVFSTYLRHIALACEGKKR